MSKENIKLALNLTKAQTVFTKKLDLRLSLHGISFNEFIIMYHINNAPQQKLRRIDLAELLGLTASGITRLLMPMEKIGLVNKEANPRDARVSLMRLSSSGLTILEDATLTLNQTLEGMLPKTSTKTQEVLNTFLRSMGASL